MISDFPNNPITNEPGIVSFKFAPLSIISAITAPVNGVIDTFVDFAGTSDFFKGYSTLGTSRLKETSKRKEQGLYYDSEFVGYMPGDSAELALLFDDMLINRFVLAVKDAKGNIRLCGSMDNPMRFEVDYDSGQNPGDTKGRSYRFFAENLQPWPFYKPVNQPGGGNGGGGNGN